MCSLCDFSVHSQRILYGYTMWLVVVSAKDVELLVAPILPKVSVFGIVELATYI